MGTTSSMGSREHKSDTVSVSSSYLTANPDVCMSGFVWMYPPRYAETERIACDRLPSHTLPHPHCFDQ